jgi:hypothetical protein
MASGDFADCKLQLAYLSGRTAVAQFNAAELALAGQCVNETVLDCYMNPGGPRPRFARQTLGIQLGAPIDFTVTVTQGSNNITVTAGGTPSPTRVGSTVKIGTNYYRYAGLSGSQQQLVEPVLEASGSYTMTMWHNSYVLGVTVVEVDEDPLVLGWGCLRPMNGVGEDYKWRQITYGDFWYPTPQGAALATNINLPGGLSFPVGDPLFYYINNEPYIAANAIASRFVVQPMPSQARSVSFSAWVIPTELSADADRPLLPADLITRVLFPLMREKWALIFKKYAGQNLQGLVASANGARAILRSVSDGQRGRPVRMPLCNV